MAISSELEQLLASWIPRQPWFPKLAADFGTDPDITPMSVARAFTYTAEELGGFVGLVTVISVGDGPTLRRLNIPLTLRGTEDFHLRHALIGRTDDLALGTVYVYDGAADPVFVNLMADAITKRKVFDGGQLSTESLRHAQDKAAAREQPQAPLPEAVPPKPSKSALQTSAPQTSAPRMAESDELPVDIRPIEASDAGGHKSTVIIHDEYEPMELSFFRVLENGMPSSLTIPVLLTEAGSRSVPEVIGWSSGRWYDMFEVTEMEAPMALLSHVDVEAEPAWREAVDTVCAVDSGSIGAYNAHAAEMGRRVGELHSDMAAEFGIVEGAGEPTKQLVKKWIERIDWALGRAPLALDSLVPELRGHRAKLQGMETIGTLQKIHGELTLDHVVSSPSDGYSVVKFTDSANSDPKPAALDLVALLRSIDYAAGFARLQRAEELDSEDGGLVFGGFGNDPAALRAILDSPEYLWASQVQNSLLSGYSRARGESIGLSDPVLRAALIDRLLVEVITELRNRPNWLSVPLSTLTLVLKGKPARAEELPTEVELSTPEVDAAEADAAEADSAEADSAEADSAEEAASSGGEPTATSSAADTEGTGAEGDDAEDTDAEDDDAEDTDAEDDDAEDIAPGTIPDEEEEVVVKRVPASFAARGAASEDSDSTGRDTPPAKPMKAPVRGTVEPGSRDTEGGADANSDPSSDTDSRAPGSVFGELSDKAKDRRRR